MSGKGISFKGKKLKPKVAPEVLKEEAASEALNIKPSKITTAAKEAKKPVAVTSMFSVPGVIVKAPAPKKKKQVAAAPTAIIKPLAEVLAEPAPATIDEFAAAAAMEPTKTLKSSFAFKKRAVAPLAEESEGKEAEAEAEAKEADAEDETAAFEDLTDEDMKEMADLILAEDKGNPYDLEAPAVYVPESRQGFSNFIFSYYRSYMLEATESAAATPTGEKYPYQKFVREYMRSESPYRGLLVYHGLGSGKTCTAIAASEALYSTANKKIIVMTPFSLRKNFLKEVSLCGFRHFQLKNYWEAADLSEPNTRLFAVSVLGIPESHLRKVTRVWIPDFRKSAEDANYTLLDSDAQSEIRSQILSILVWHKTKNPNGRIRFINYNGISARCLKEIACNVEGGKCDSSIPNFFDDAVIVVDEIHNLVRLMQGTIDPYLVKKPQRRLIPFEPVTAEKWSPTLCNQDRNYDRGYLFYRLLLDAKNSKIIGLSGTPIINFAEELGILMNVLHGYIIQIEGILEAVGSIAIKKIKDIAMVNPYTDFVESESDSGGIRLTCTLLPFGLRKATHTDPKSGEIQDGVERIEDGGPTAETVLKELLSALQKAGFNEMRGKELTLSALPLLPPTAEEFTKYFIQGNKLNNKAMLVKRLTGLISYYKGSRADLMPSVKVDEVVHVPMSAHSQKMYVQERELEVAAERKKKKKGAGAGEALSGAWAKVYEVDAAQQTNSYKMASRQACNFTFPSSVTRPKPGSKKDVEAEAGKTRDIVDTAPDSGEPRDAEEFPELEAEDKEEQAEFEQALADDDAALATAEVDENAAPVEDEEAQSGGQMNLDEEINEKGAAAAVTTTTSPIAQPSRITIAERLAQKRAEKAAAAAASEEARLAQLPADCKEGQKPGESYQDAIVRAKECLRTIGRRNLILGGEDGLEVYSPKYAEILKRVEAAPGSSLVYSQFLDMEGIGIFRIAMDINGYSQIEIQRTGAGGVAFTKRTLDSLKKGPAGQSRYMTFSGGEEEDIRRMYLDIFNANFDGLEGTLASVLRENGFTNNHKGEICRVFCITRAGAEGLSLKCVRAVHLMEPYWNEALMTQVKGRAIRIGSHLELPEADRNVSIYTYLSVFSEEAQLLKAGEGRIDEDLRLADGLDRKSAMELGLPVPAKAAQYVITTDERLYLISKRKKNITDALEAVMKAAAIDCRLNIKQNKDDKLQQCLDVRGKVGDFLFHPNFEKDRLDSAKFEEAMSMAVPAAAAQRVAKPVVAAPPAGKPVPLVTDDYIMQKYQGRVYRMRKKKDAAGRIIGYEMYDRDDETYKTMLGRTGATKEGKIGMPVEVF